MQDLFGGSSGSQQSTGSSGFSLLPQDIQGAFNSLGSQATSLFGNGGGTALNMLPGLSGGAATAQNQLQNQNFAPTAANIASNVAMQTNPYDSSVIGSIQNAQNGALSQLNSEMTNAGQFGSNRSMLGASDIANQQANEVGTFENSEFQNAMNNALTTIPQAQTASAQGAVNSGLLTQQQQMQNQQAPVTALSQLASLLGVLPNSGGSTQQGSGSNSSSGGIVPGLAALFGGSK